MCNKSDALYYASYTNAILGQRFRRYLHWNIGLHLGHPTDERNISVPCPGGQTD